MYSQPHLGVLSPYTTSISVRALVASGESLGTDLVQIFAFLACHSPECTFLGCMSQSSSTSRDFVGSDFASSGERTVRLVRTSEVDLGMARL